MRLFASGAAQKRITWRIGDVTVYFNQKLIKSFNIKLCDWAILNQYGNINKYVFRIIL